MLGLMPIGGIIMNFFDNSWIAILGALLWLSGLYIGGYMVVTSLIKCTERLNALKDAREKWTKAEARK